MSAGSEMIARLRRAIGDREPGAINEQRFAVLVPLIETEGGLEVLFEVRSSRVVQAGEICFPGGRAEGTESLGMCALRETQEELAIPPERIRLLGRSDFLVTHRGGFIQPFVGLIDEEALEAHLRPSPDEVAEVFTVPLDFFINNEPEIWKNRHRILPAEGFPYARYGLPEDYYADSGFTTDIHFWLWQSRVIWGLTARILYHLIGKLK